MYVYAFVVWIYTWIYHTHKYRTRIFNRRISSSSTKSSEKKNKIIELWLIDSNPYMMANLYGWMKKNKAKTDTHYGMEWDGGHTTTTAIIITIVKFQINRVQYWISIFLEYYDLHTHWHAINIRTTWNFEKIKKVKKTHH